MATTGALIWFNTVSQFPYFLLHYGGSAFLVVYLLAVLVFTVPLVIVQMALGRRAGGFSPITGVTRLAEREHLARAWPLLAWLGTALGFVVFAYYSVFAGWTIAQVVRAAGGYFSGLTPDGVASLFVAFVRDPERQLFWHAAFIVLVMAVVARGPRHGIEPLLRLVLPVIFALAGIMLIYCASLGTLSDGVTRVATMDFSQLTPEGFLMALGQAFFGASAGTTALVAYGSYLPADAPLGRLSFWAVAGQVLFGCIAAAVISSLLLAGAMPPASGYALLFQTFPVVFDHLANGRLMGTLFFLLLVLIAFVSAVSFVEPLVAFLVERFKMARLKAAAITGAAAWMLGLVFILSFSVWSFSFRVLGVQKDYGVFDIFVILTSYVLLPLSALGFAFFVGWKVSPPALEEDVRATSPCLFEIWLWLARVAVPLLILLLLLNLARFIA